MSYCTVADLQARIGHDPLAIIGDRDGDSVAEQAVLNAALADVDALIDAAIGLRWPQCVGQASPVLRMIAVDLVLERIARGLARTEELIDAASRAEKRLADLAAGRAVPCAAAGPGSDPHGGAVATATDRVFTRQHLSGVL